MKLKGKILGFVLYFLFLSLIFHSKSTIWTWEVGGGRTTRQLGQVWKEAALTSSGTGHRAGLLF